MLKSFIYIPVFPFFNSNTLLHYSRYTLDRIYNQYHYSREQGIRFWHLFASFFD